MDQGITTHLSIGTDLEYYKILDILGKGGFGVTYLAQDTRLKQKVAIKEYFPTEMGIRATDNVTLNAHSERVDDYQFGLNKFLEEARVLAQFKHPNIVRVSNFLKLHGTAYLIMDFEQGEDLSDYLKRTEFKGNMPETELKSYLVPILKGLHAVHDKGLLHRDVKPGNIYLRKDAEPMLIDFGAARYALGEHSKSMSAIISMGYAPPEQYSSKGKQNQASDLYAWGATAYQLITGKQPIESPDRSNAFFEGEDDPLKPLTQTHAGKYSQELLSTIDNCLQLPNKTRPQSAVQVMALLKGEQPKSNKTKKVNPSERFKNTKPKQSPMSSSTPFGDPSFRKPPKSNTLKYIIASLFVIALISGSYFGYDYYQTQQAQAEQIRLADQKVKQEQQKAQEKAKKAQQQAWTQAEQGNTIASYQSYLDKHPNGENQNQANDKIKQLRAELGNLTTQAQILLVKLSYQVPTDGRNDARTEAAIKDFETKQNILVTGKADQVLINSLQIAYNKKDQAAWNLAQGDINKLQNYASNYPDGQFINQVNDKITSIRKAQQAAEAERLRLAKLAEEEKQRKAAEAEKERQRLAKLAEEKRELVTSIQKQLKRLGHKTQVINGQLGNNTSHRIKSYQKIKKQSQTGEATQELLVQLKTENKLPEPKPGETYKDCYNCPEMVVIPSGSFQMGSNEEVIEKPIHTVTIKQFSMSQTEVTFNQWDACYNAGGCSHKPKDEGWGRGNSPVINVNWNDAQEYIKWLNSKTGQSYRLPSESEWEYAARAGSSTKYSWGDSIGSNKANCGSNQCSDSYDNSSPVKSFSANSFDLYDMHGNVQEWVQDKWHNNYNGAPTDGSAWISGSSFSRVMRGGSLGNYASYLRSASRLRYTPDLRISNLGFRLAQDK